MKHEGTDAFQPVLGTTPATEIEGANFMEWLESRRYRRLLWGLPALLCTASAMGYLVFLIGWEKAHAETRAYEMAQTALIDRNYTAAQVAYRSLLQISGRQHPEYTFKLAISYLGLGREQDGTALLTSLAPADRPGYPPAHIFLARTLLARTNLDNRSFRASELHLVNAIKADPNNVEAHDLLSQIYYRTARWDKAKKHLLEIVSTRPEVMLVLADVLRLQGDEAAARSYAERAAKHFRLRLDQAKPEETVPRVGLAEALSMLGEFPEAFAVLEKGYNASTNKLYENAMADVCAAWVRALARESPNDLATRLRVAQQGLKFAPQNHHLLKELIALTSASGPEARAADETIRKMLAEGGDSSLLHFCLGLHAWKRGERERSINHFKLAFTMAAHLPGVANNMAMMMALDEPPDLAKALEIIQPVVEQYPENAEFRDTRGHILLRMGKYQDAVRDLETALPRASNKGMAHAALAEAYRKLGMNDLAAEHERASQAISGTPYPTNALPAFASPPKG